MFERTSQVTDHPQESLLPLVCGGRVVLASREQVADATALILLLREQKISVMQATPTTWCLLL
jgi:non-ribosomal peptide synthetase component F